MHDRKFISDTLDTEEIKKLCADIPEEDAGTFSVEEILAEYKYDDTVNIKLISQDQKTGEKASEREVKRNARTDTAPSQPVSEKTEEKPSNVYKVPENAVKPKIITIEKSFNIGEEGQEPEEAPPETPDAKTEAVKRELTYNELEEVGVSQEDSPAQAYQKLKQRLKGLGMKATILFIIWAVLSYISFAHRFSWPMPDFAVYVKYPYIHLLILALLQLCAMLLCADMLAKGAFDLVKLRPSMETLLAAGCLTTFLHVFSVMLFPQWGGYLPYSAIASGSLFFAYWGRYLRMSALCINFKAAGSTSSYYLARGGQPLYGGVEGCIKNPANNADGYVSRCSEQDIMRRAERYLSPMLLISCLVFAALSSFGRQAPSDFFLAWAAISAPAAAFPAFISFTLPFYLVSRRLYMSGAGIAGWLGAKAMSKSRSVILSDTDIFPPGTVSINGLKVLGGYPVDRVIAYTTSVVAASGSGIARVFSELLQGQSSAISRVDNFQHYEGGGMGADISGSRILVGSPNFMLSMGIKPPKGVALSDAVLTAINHEPVAMFVLSYTASANTRRSLNSLIRHKLIPVLATRDFNITPSLFTAKFKLNSDIPEFPSMEDKLKLSDAESPVTGEPDGIICREGLTAFSELILLGRRLYSVSRLSAIFSAASAAIGVLIMFYLVFTGSYAAAAPGSVMTYMLLWTIASLFVSSGVGRY